MKSTPRQLLKWKESKLYIYIHTQERLLKRGGEWFPPPISLAMRRTFSWLVGLENLILRCSILLSQVSEMGPTYCETRMAKGLILQKALDRVEWTLVPSWMVLVAKKVANIREPNKSLAQGTPILVARNGLSLVHLLSSLRFATHNIILGGWVI